MAMMFNHHQWGVAFGILGNIISFLVYLAPAPTFYRIYRKKSTESFEALPYLVALFSSMLWFYYALVKQNAFLLVTINSFGCVIETIYIVLFITYAPKDRRNSTVKLFASMNIGVFSLILLLTHFLATDSNRIPILGWICVAFSVSVFAAPLSIVAQVIRTKSVEFMPFNLSFFLTLSAIMWFAYGLFQKDICVALPNIVGFLLGLVQMLLYAIYKNGAKKDIGIDITIIDEKKLPEVQLKNIVILSNLGASDQVYPVDIIHLDDTIDHQTTGNNKEEAKEDHHHDKEESTDDHDQRNEKSLEASSDLQHKNNNNNSNDDECECAVVVVV